MKVEDTWSHFFKPEVRKQGADLFEDGTVVLSIAADTQIQAFVKVSARAKVSFTTESIASPVFLADCSCSSSQKGQFCKHIWATLLKVEESYPDFLDSKSEIEKGSQLAAKAAAAAPKPKVQTEFQAAQKAKQADYRKQQYQFQKQKQDKKQSKVRRVEASPNYPEPVASALSFFSENGFEFGSPIDKADIVNARKILARVFHPDKGGSHEEALLLNQNYDILIEYLRG